MKRQEDFRKELTKERIETEERSQVFKMISKELSLLIRDESDESKKEQIEPQDTLRKEFSERQENKNVSEMHEKELSQREEHFKSEQVRQIIQEELSEKEQALKKDFLDQINLVRTLIADQEKKQRKLEITIMERERLSKLEVAAQKKRKGWFMRVRVRFKSITTPKGSYCSLRLSWASGSKINVRADQQPQLKNLFQTVWQPAHRGRWNTVHPGERGKQFKIHFYKFSYVPFLAS